MQSTKKPRVDVLIHSSLSGECIDFEVASFLWTQIENDKGAYGVFDSFGVKSLDDFIKFADNKDNLLALGFVDGRFAAMVWTTSPREKSCDVHFVTLRWTYRGVNKLTCAMILDTLLHIHSNDDEYMFDCLIGCTPLSNRLACRFVKELGLAEVGVMPRGYYDSKNRKSTDALITCCTRESLVEVSKWTQ